MEINGEVPGWIRSHRARYRGGGEIVITGGDVLSIVDGEEQSAHNGDTFVLDLAKSKWSRERVGNQ
jgi:hypothetical protein